MRRMTLLCALLLAALLSPATRAATIVNGSFEPTPGQAVSQFVGTGSTLIPGWTGIDTGVEWYQPAAFGTGPAAHGLYIVDLANYIFSAGGIEQTFATNAGEVISISFMLSTTIGAGRDGTCQIEVSADGQTTAYNATNLSAVNVWTSRLFTFVADGPSATLRFRCLQNANLHFANIDAVGVTAVTPTRPTSWTRVKSLFR